jgi:hypothetical protein
MCGFQATPVSFHAFLPGKLLGALLFGLAGLKRFHLLL